MIEKFKRWDRAIRALGIPFLYSTTLKRVYKRGKVTITYHLLKGELNINGDASYPVEMLLYPDNMRFIINKAQNENKS